jgi:hypothetical protein
MLTARGRHPGTYGPSDPGGHAVPGGFTIGDVATETVGASRSRSQPRPAG